MKKINKKIVVYAISKNEEKFVHRWFNSMKEADEIYVLDTGSTDNTVKLLKELGVKVVEKNFSFFRFDIARNESLKLVPKNTDICVCTDLDEVFEVGWRKKLEELWQEEFTNIYYYYNWDFNEENKPTLSFYISKIHKKTGCSWIHPVHEVLKYNKEQKYIYTDNIVLNHYADKTKSRNSYLPLLELSIKEDPEDDRNMHYLGREYMFHQKYEDAINTLKKHLALKKATWKDERCASMRFIARCYSSLNKTKEAKKWLKKAIDEAPKTREPFFEMGYLMYQLENYKQAKYYLKESLKIKQKNKSYLNESFCWDGHIEDILSVCEYNLKNFNSALMYAKKSLKLNPNDERTKENIKIFQSFVNK